MSKKNILAINGTFWGDEGKGKITDYFASRADIIVRSQGGNNAGHTIIINNKKYSLRLLPSGIYNPNIINILSNGMVIDLEFLITEIALVKKDLKNLKLIISDRAHIVMPYHKELDKMWEEQRDNKIGTTKKGIGPAYSDKALRMGIRIGDLLDKNLFFNKLEMNSKIVNKLFKAFDYDYQVNFKELANKFYKYGMQIKDYIGNSSEYLNNAIAKNKKILFEGAQGSMLCIDHGTYPMVTSSSPTSISIPLNAGIPSRHIENVLGITKAYVTRVGEGFFATEFNNEISDRIREIGHEYGTVTERARRIGWLDIFVLKYVIRVSGITHLSIMLLDVLSGITKIKICVGYKLDGKKLTFLPSSLSELERCKPIYIEIDGWNDDLSKITKYDDLPINAKIYITTIEKLTNIEVAIISVGPERKQTIIKGEIF